jgi:hypothetical protein
MSFQLTLEKGCTYLNTLIQKSFSKGSAPQTPFKSMKVLSHKSGFRTHINLTNYLKRNRILRVPFGSILNSNLETWTWSSKHQTQTSTCTCAPIPTLVVIVTGFISGWPASREKLQATESTYLICTSEKFCSGIKQSHLQASRLQHPRSRTVNGRPTRSLTFSIPCGRTLHSNIRWRREC